MPSLYLQKVWFCNQHHMPLLQDAATDATARLIFSLWNKKVDVISFVAVALIEINCHCCFVLLPFDDDNDATMLSHRLMFFLHH